MSKRGGSTFRGRRTRDPDPLSFSHSFSLLRSLSLSRVTGRRLASPPAVTCRRREKEPVRPSSTRCQPPNTTNPPSPTSHNQAKFENHTSTTLILPPTCQNPVTHTRFGLLYKSGGRIRPQTPSIATKTPPYRALGFEFSS